MKFSGNANLRIWLWPIVIFLSITLATAILANLVRYYFPEAAHIEKIMDFLIFAVIGLALVALLWTLLYRYQSIGGVHYPRKTKLYLCIFTVLYFVVLICNTGLLILNKY